MTKPVLPIPSSRNSVNGFFYNSSVPPPPLPSSSKPIICIPTNSQFLPQLSPNFSSPITDNFHVNCWNAPSTISNFQPFSHYSMDQPQHNPLYTIPQIKNHINEAIPSHLYPNMNGSINNITRLNNNTTVTLNNGSTATIVHS